MTKEQIMVELFEFSAPTYYKWSKHEKRKIFDLLNYAFSEEELIEYIKDKKIQKIEDVNSVSNFLDLTNKFYVGLASIKNKTLANTIIKLIKEDFKEKKEINLASISSKVYKLKDESLFENIDEDKYKIVDLLKKYELVLSYFIQDKK